MTDIEIRYAKLVEVARDLVKFPEKPAVMQRALEAALKELFIHLRLEASRRPARIEDTENAQG